MKTRFDVDEDVFIHGRIKSIAINEQGEIGYKIAIRSDTGIIILIFDEGEIVKLSQDKIDTKTPEAMKTCGRCKYKLNLTHDISSPCYMCYRNPDEGRLPDNWVKDDE